MTVDSLGRLDEMILTIDYGVVMIGWWWLHVKMFWDSWLIAKVKMFLQRMKMSLQKQQKMGGMRPWEHQLTAAALVIEASSTGTPMRTPSINWFPQFSTTEDGKECVQRQLLPYSSVVKQYIAQTHFTCSFDALNAVQFSLFSKLFGWRRQRSRDTLAASAWHWTDKDGAIDQTWS